MNGQSVWGVVVGFAMMGLVLVACGEAEQTATAGSTERPSPTVDDLGTVIAMQQAATRVPSATPRPSATPTATPSPTPTPTATQTATLTPTETPPDAPSLTPTPPTPSPYPTNTPRSTQARLRPLTSTPVAEALFDQTGELRDHYWLARPFPRDPTNRIRDYASRSYPYGTTGGGQFQTHHGVDIQNLQGTAILAVAGGWVVYAGDDSVEMFGPQNNFYGNLVVIEHDRVSPDGRPVYTLYGHMMRVDVATGQRVEMLQKIGQVGSTGVALGAHLHLEVRIGDPHDYNSTYNPDLWLRPWPNFGTLAGRITDKFGNRLYDMQIIIQPEDGPDRFTYSYADDSVNPDPYYGEHFTYADLPAGDYQVIVRKQGVLRYKGKVTIEDGKTSWLEIQLN